MEIADRSHPPLPARHLTEGTGRRRAFAVHRPQQRLRP